MLQRMYSFQILRRSHSSYSTENEMFELYRTQCTLSSHSLDGESSSGSSSSTVLLSSLLLVVLVLLSVVVVVVVVVSVVMVLF